MEINADAACTIFLFSASDLSRLQISAIVYRTSARSNNPEVVMTISRNMVRTKSRGDFLWAVSEGRKTANNTPKKSSLQIAFFYLLDYDKKKKKTNTLGNGDAIINISSVNSAGMAWRGVAWRGVVRCGAACMTLYWLAFG